MLEIYTGKVGGGKTYAATRTMVRALAGGHLVWSNILLHMDKVIPFVRQNFGVEVDPTQYTHVPDENVPNVQRLLPNLFADPQGRRALLVIDEAQLWFNARDHAETYKASKEFLTYLTQHRKVAHDVVFVTQHEHNINAQFVRLAQSIWRYRDMRTMRVPFLGLGYPLAHCLCHQVENDGRTAIYSDIRPFSPTIFKLYDTCALLKPLDMSLAPATKTDPKKAKKSMLSSMRPLMVIAALLALVAGLWAYRTFTAPPKAETPPALAAAPAAATATRWKQRTETFTGWFEFQATVQTDQDQYTLGENREEGRVAMIEWEKVTIQPHGRPGASLRPYFVFLSHDRRRLSGWAPAASQAPQDAPAPPRPRHPEAPTPRPASKPKPGPVRTAAVDLVPAGTSTAVLIPQ